MNTNMHCTRCGAALHEHAAESAEAFTAKASGLLLTDRQFVQGLQQLGVEVLHSGSNTVPELRLRSIHEFADLEHIGFGSFKNATHLFLRHTSPQGTRFYECCTPSAAPTKEHAANTPLIV